MEPMNFVIFYVTYPSANIALLARHRSYKSATSEQAISEQAAAIHAYRDPRFVKLKPFRKANSMTNLRNSYGSEKWASNGTFCTSLVCSTYS